MYLLGEDTDKAIAYYRHSAEDKQENSVTIQRKQVERFAEKENIQIIAHYQDEGISGVTADRPGFQRMFDEWMCNDTAPSIQYVLVYDASRFGRFQKMSEVWKWIGLCEDKDIKLATVTRGLPNNGSIMDSFMLTLDFGMSGDFSKVLSDKVFYGSVMVSEQGYSAGGTAPYGYVRVLLDEQRQRIGILKRGEHKMISNQRVAFEPATNGEQDIVVHIFNEFVSLNKQQIDIANDLNNESIPTALGRQWTASGITRILSNETYMGTRVYNKTWHRLHKPMRRNLVDSWVRCLDAHQALVSSDLFNKAQERLYWLGRAKRYQGGRLIGKAKLYMRDYIQQVTKDMPDGSWDLFAHRFMPMSYGIKNRGKTYFYVPSERSQYGKILLCVIDPKEESPIKAVYLIDSSEVANRPYVVIDEQSSRQKLDTNELHDAIIYLLLTIYERVQGGTLDTPKIKSSSLQYVV